MMNRSIALKAIADETRMKLLTILLRNNCCVRALARRLEVTEATVSQHLKILREAGLLTREKRGYFTHYSVNRGTLRELAGELKALAAIKRVVCMRENTGCRSSEPETCGVASYECGCGCAGV